jgi:hypothetical protein
MSAVWHRSAQARIGGGTGIAALAVLSGRRVVVAIVGNGEGRRDRSHLLVMGLSHVLIGRAMRHP